MPSDQPQQAAILDLLDQTGIAHHCSAPLQQLLIREVTADSRQVRPGALFVAVPGTQHDGHAFIDQAVAAGAVAVMVQHPGYDRSDVPCLRVADTAEALARLLGALTGVSALSAARRLTLVGVTGTNGKSTTCHLLQTILNASGLPAALIGTVRYDLVGETRPAPWTTPPAPQLTAALLRAHHHGAAHAVMEVSSHALSQQRVAGLTFSAAVFTNLSGDHLDYHANGDDYARAKKRLFDHLPADGWAVVNADDPRHREMVADCPAATVRFGLQPGADATAAVRASAITGTEFELHLGGQTRHVRLPLVGRYNVNNALAAATTAHCLGIDFDTIQRALDHAPQIAGRLQRSEPPGHPFSVFVDYAHTDDALENVLSAIKPLTPGRLWCLFGCGGDRDRSKRPRMAQVAARLADQVVITSDNPRSEDPQAIIRDIMEGVGRPQARRIHSDVDRRQAIAMTLRLAEPGDVVLIAGKGHEDYQIIGRQRLHFDDAEVVGDCLRPAEIRGAHTPSAQPGRCS